jgi:hypothetical protein
MLVVQQRHNEHVAVFGVDGMQESRRSDVLDRAKHSAMLCVVMHLLLHLLQSHASVVVQERLIVVIGNVGLGKLLLFTC